MEKNELNTFLSNSLNEFEAEVKQIVPCGNRPVTQDELFEFAKVIHKLFSDFKEAITE